MSIIHDALKKTQMEFERRQWRQTKSSAQPLTAMPEFVSAASPDPAPSVPPKKTTLYTAGLVCLFVVIAGLLFALVDLSWNRFPAISQHAPFPFRSYQPASVATASLEKNSPPSLPAIRQNSHAVIKKPAAAQEALVLTGTMMIGKTRVALINGENYEIGDSIGNKKIVNITLEKVELLNNNGEITILHVRRKQ